MSQGDPPESESIKSRRRANPSSWLELTDNQTLPLVVDALLDSPPGKEYNKTELANFAGVSRESVREHIETLLKFGIVEEVDDTTPTRYRLNDHGKATVSLFELNSALNSVASGEKENVELKQSEQSDADPLLENRSRLYDTAMEFGDQLGENIG